MFDNIFMSEIRKLLFRFPCSDLVNLYYMTNRLTQREYKNLTRQLKLMGFADYKDFLNSKIWKEMRKIMFKEKGVVCTSKKCKSVATHIHHTNYRSLLNPLFLYPYCKNCHNKIHRSIYSIKKATSLIRNN